MYIIGLTMGLIGGALITAFVIGASRLNHENEIYADGHIAGYTEGYVAGQNDKERGTK